ncbi:peroxiredoxin family protein [Mucilaginibacter celer]|nr:TlpA disulfide reductase family protein [Mucilaginibacter celer]
MTITAKKYILPNGDTISIAKLDSVIKSWKKAEIMFHPDRSDPEILHIRPLDDAYYQELAAHEVNINSLLNKPAPIISLKAINGKNYSLNEFRGKVVVLNFWFTSCGTCIQEMPKLNAITTQYATSKVVFLALAPDNTSMIKAFLKKHQFKYTLLSDAEKTISTYQIFGYPTSMVIDKNGIIRSIHSNPDNIKQKLTQSIDQLLAE